MMMKVKDCLRVTLAQVDLKWEDPEQNRKTFEPQIMALSGKSDLVILPETFTTGFSVQASDFAEPIDGLTVNWMQRLSHTANLAIGGTLFVEDNGLIYNRFLFVTPDRKVLFYDKRHLFSIGGESDFFTPGNQRLIVNYLGWRIAPYICYDIRFPVWCRNSDDTDLMIFAANWPASRSVVWNTLLKARAIENQVYVAGINRIGTDANDIFYSGESQMVNSRGSLLSEFSLTDKGWLTYEISKSELDEFRRKFPVARDADRFIII